MWKRGYSFLGLSLQVLAYTGRPTMEEGRAASQAWLTGPALPCKGQIWKRGHGFCSMAS